MLILDTICTVEYTFLLAKDMFGSLSSNESSSIHLAAMSTAIEKDHTTNLILIIFPFLILAQFN